MFKGAPKLLVACIALPARDSLIPDPMTLSCTLSRARGKADPAFWNKVSVEYPPVN
jgi:hypothetical protein